MQKKRRGERITALTGYDYPTARLLDAAGIDVLLVGDSLAMVVLGQETTLPVTMDEMLHHARTVARGTRRALLVGDMPFLSYQPDTAEAVRNAGRFLQAGMHAVKLEGGRDYATTVRALVRAGIPVMGHVDLLPQSVRRLGGFRARAGRRNRPGRCSTTRSRSRRRARSRSCSRVCRRRWPPWSPSGCRCPRSGSAPGRAPTARSS